jgi:hypothetical protein
MCEKRVRERETRPSVRPTLDLFSVRQNATDLTTVVVQCTFECAKYNAWFSRSGSSLLRWLHGHQRWKLRRPVATGHAGQTLRGVATI